MLRSVAVEDATRLSIWSTRDDTIFRRVTPIEIRRDPSSSLTSRREFGRKDLAGRRHVRAKMR